MNSKFARRLASMSGIALVLGSVSAGAQNVEQKTTVLAPITAVALGRAKAEVEVNVVEVSPGMGPVRQTVIVTHPLTVIAPPGTNVSLRIGVSK